MTKVIWISSIIILILIGGFFGYKFIFNESDYDGLNDNVYVKERESSDNLLIVSECDSMEKLLTYEKAHCYKKIAQQQRDILVCEKISSDNIDNLKFSYGSNTSYLRDECYAYVAFVMNDVSICNDIIGPREDGCIRDIGTRPAYKDADCEKLKEMIPSQGDLCYKLKAIQGEDSKICEDIESIEEKDFCYRHISANKMDSSVCNNIQTTWIKSLCLET